MLIVGAELATRLVGAGKSVQLVLQQAEMLSAERV